MSRGRQHRTGRSAGVAATVLVVVLAVLAGGCTGLPESGPVTRESGAGTDQQDTAARFDAPGPGPGDSPVQIVNGFLTAMTANPTAAATARSFLTRSAAGAWNPTGGTLVYETSTVTPGLRSTVATRLSNPRLLDARGGWLGPGRAGSGRLTMHLVRQRGEWRIANPPDALLVPDYFLEQEYQPFDLYFFDQTSRVLVPDRIYVPRGEQTPSLLVRALLDGPGRNLAPVTRTAFLPQTQLDLSVPVAADGTADVPLSKQILRLPPAQLTRAAAQLAWTLRQVPGVSRIRLTVDDTAVPLPDGRRSFPVGYGASFSPGVTAADTSVFALAKGRLVRFRPGAEPRSTSGAFGGRGFALRSVAVDLPGERAAAVTASGRRLLLAPVSTPAGQKAVAPRRVYDGIDLERPAYDMFGNLWVVDRTPRGATIVQISARGARTVEVPGVSGRDVTAFLVSRDGGRFVALIDRGARGDAMVTADLLRSADGGLASAARGFVVPLPPDLRDLRDLVWHSPSDVAVLGGSSPIVAEVALVTLDGSPGDLRAVPPDVWRGRVLGLVGAPDLAEPLYLVTGDGRLRRLDSSGRWGPAGTTLALSVPTYVG